MMHTSLVKTLQLSFKLNEDKKIVGPQNSAVETDWWMVVVVMEVVM